jgi:hypothetical protein
MKKLINFEDIDRARKMLGLEETASMQEIKDKYRKLSLKYHPDRHNNSSRKKKYEEKIKEINNSYEILMNYCIKYPISFKADKVKYIEEGEYEKQHLKRFFDGWWGDMD